MTKTKYTIYWQYGEQFGISYQTMFLIVAKIKFSLLKHKNISEGFKLYFQKSWVSNNYKEDRPLVKPYVIKCSKRFLCKTYEEKCRFLSIDLESIDGNNGKQFTSKRDFRRFEKQSYKENGCCGFVPNKIATTFFGYWK